MSITDEYNSWDSFCQSYKGEDSRAATTARRFIEDSEVLELTTGRTKLRVQPCTGRRCALLMSRQSESVRYASLDIYVGQESFEGRNVAVVLQCRQMRGYDVGPETVNWEMQSRFEEFCSAAFGPNVINQNWMMRLYMTAGLLEPQHDQRHRLSACLRPPPEQNDRGQVRLTCEPSGQVRRIVTKARIQELPPHREGSLKTSPLAPTNVSCIF